MGFVLLPSLSTVSCTSCSLDPSGYKNRAEQHGFWLAFSTEKIGCGISLPKTSIHTIHIPQFFQFSDENSWKGSQIPAREVCRLDVTLWMSSGCTFGAQGKARQGHTQKMVCEVCPAGSRFLAHIEKPDKMTQNDTANRQIYATSMPWQLVREGSDTCCIITWTLVAPCCWRRTTVMHCAHFLNTTAVFASESGVPSVHRKNGRTSPEGILCWPMSFS